MPVLKMPGAIAGEAKLRFIGRLSAARGCLRNNLTRILPG